MFALLGGLWISCCLLVRLITWFACLMWTWVVWYSLLDTVMVFDCLLVVWFSVTRFVVCFVGLGVLLLICLMWSWVIVC